LVPVVVDVQSYALQSAMERLVALQFQDKKDLLCALFKIGASRTVLQVSRGDEIVYERDQGVGGEQLTQRIAEHYGYSQSDAEKRKQAGNLPQDYESAVLAPFVGSMVQVFERGTHLFFNSTAFNKLDQVFLAGGGALVGGLAASISSALQAPCSIVNPFEGMTLGASFRKQESLQSAPMYLGACGLALRRFQA
jgi:type IV pilus assembly protein PilM